MSDETKTWSQVRQVGPIEVLAERPMYGQNVRLLFMVRNRDGEAWMGQPMTWRKLGDAEVLVSGEETATLRPKEAQLLMDELWRCGVRPSNGAGNTGELQATQKHLDDMRKMNERLLDYTLRPRDLLHIGPTPGVSIAPIGGE
jgi:hypothetical protein